MVLPLRSNSEARVCLCACAVIVWLIALAHLEQNNGGSNILKRENSELWRAIFPNCAPVSLGEQRILVKQVFIY